MPASISTRLDEQEFLELADCYYANPRREVIGNPSRTGSTATISTNTHLRRRDTAPGPRWRPSTLKECDDSRSASGEVDEFYQYDLVEGQTFSHIVIDPLKTPSSISLESYSDDTQTVRSAKGPDLTFSPLNTLPPRIQIPHIEPVVRSSPSNPSRPISMASLVSESCFSIIRFPRWNKKGSSKSGPRSRKQRKLQATQSINRGRESSPANGFSTIPLDSSQSGGEYFMSLPSRELASASASSPFIGLDYDYHLAVEVLINGSNVEPESMP